MTFLASRRAFWLGVLVFLGGIGSMMALVCLAPMLPQPQPQLQPSSFPAPEAPLALPVPPPTQAGPAGERRLPVAGAAGTWIVLAADGTSYLERADGVREQLTAPFQPDPPPVPAPVLAPLTAPPARGRLIVLDRGVVEVPQPALVTYQGGDYLVAVDPADGTTTAYYVDGRVEPRVAAPLFRNRINQPRTK